MVHVHEDPYAEGRIVGSRLSSSDVGLFLEGFAHAIGEKMVREAHGTGHMMSVPIDTLTALITTANRLKLLAQRSGGLQQGDRAVHLQQE